MKSLSFGNLTKLWLCIGSKPNFCTLSDNISYSFALQANHIVRKEKGENAPKNIYWMR